METCQKCGGGEFESRWKGLSYEFRCAKCHWGAVTTLFPPIHHDKGLYRIVITPLGSNPNRALIALNRRPNRGILEVRREFLSGEREFFSGDAYSVWKEAQLLRDDEVPFRIEPDFPYDLATYDVMHGHEHDWRPCSNGGIDHGIR